MLPLLRRYLLLTPLAVFSLLAQTTASQRPFVVAFGQATVSTQPDQTKIQFSVVTQAARHDESRSVASAFWKRLTARREHDSTRMKSARRGR